jgi:hypothetical protein
MAKASINFKPVKASSEMHNERVQELDYVESAFSSNNENWKSHSIQEMEREVKRYCKETSGRKLQKNAEPIREAVVNLNQHHSMGDLKKLANNLEEKGMKCFQIHIHRDEGRWVNDEFKFNYHAHMVFRWQDMETGKTLRLNKADLSQIQTLVADTLGMERGDFKENSNRERLEAVEYKVQQESFKANILEKQNNVLEQKKNEVRARIAKLEAEGGKDITESTETALKRIIFSPTEVFYVESQALDKYNENDLNQAIEALEQEIQSIEAKL